MHPIHYASFRGKDDRMCHLGLLNELGMECYGPTGCRHAVEPKALIDNRATVSAVQFAQNPEPDYVDVDIDALPYDEP